MISLYLPDWRLTRSKVAMCRSRSKLFQTVLALVATLMLFAVSCWHSAKVHEHHPSQVAAVEHTHDRAATTMSDDGPSPKQDDDDNPVHMLAHASGHWIGHDGPSNVAAPTIFTEPVWLVLEALFRSGTDPFRLLRPPRG